MDPDHITTPAQRIWDAIITIALAPFFISALLAIYALNWIYDCNDDEPDE